MMLSCTCLWLLFAHAGPVVAAACIVPEHVEIPGLDDSKKLGAEQRAALYEQLTSHADVSWAVSMVEADVIDRWDKPAAALQAIVL
jgi:ribonuclease HII